MPFMNMVFDKSTEQYDVPKLLNHLAQEIDQVQLYEPATALAVSLDKGFVRSLWQTHESTTFIIVLGMLE